MRKYVKSSKSGNKYDVCFQVIGSYDVVVTADSEEEAIDLAWDQVYDGVDCGDLTDVDFDFSEVFVEGDSFYRG